MRVGIVNDMAMAREVLRRVVESTAIHRVAWAANDGREAVEKAIADRPDMILMDLIMPVMDGVEATRQIMQRVPCAILLVTSTVTGNFQQVYEAMGHGALDAVETPLLGSQGIQGATDLLQKLDLITTLLEGSTLRPRPQSPPETRSLLAAHAPLPLLLLGASTGGPQALAKVLADLPADFPAAIVIAQHVDAAFAEGLADWLNTRSKIQVHPVRGGEALSAGTAWLAATNDHLVINANHSLSYTPIPRETPYRPSVDVLFFSVARHWRGSCCAVLMTGMGRDGAEGLLALREHGAFTIAQDQASSVVFGMPRAAIDLRAAKSILPLPSISSAVQDYFYHQTASTPCPTKPS